MNIQIGRFEMLTIAHLNRVYSDSILVMQQFTVVGIFGFSLRIHQFFKGDGEWFHTHPRSFVSVGLWGMYYERWIDAQGSMRDRFALPGTLTIRSAKTPHNVQPLKFPCLTVALTTPIINQWSKGKCESF